MQKPTNQSKFWKIILAIGGIISAILFIFLRKPSSGFKDLAQKEKDIAEKRAQEQQEEVSSVNKDIDDFNKREEEVDVPKDLETLRKKYDEI